MGASQFSAAVWWRPSGFFLDGVELRVTADGLLGDGGALRSVDVDELAPGMGHAGDLADSAGAVGVFEPGIAVGLHPAAEAGEVILRTLAFPVTREPIPSGGRGIAPPQSFVTGIGPEPGTLGLACAGRQHADRCVVGKNRLGRQDMTSDGIGEGFQQGGGLADPVGQGRAVEVEPLSVEDLPPAIQAKMIGVFADQNARRETRAGAAPLARARGQWGLNEAFSAGAGQPGPDDAVHDEAAGDVFQVLGHIFADPAQVPAAIGTGIGDGAEFHFHPWDMVRDRRALGFVPLLDVGHLHPCCHRGGGDLAGLDREL